MKNLLRSSGWTLAIVCALTACAAPAQQSFYQSFRADNSSMTEVQPSWIGPLIQSDARLGQAIRFSVSNSQSPGTHPINYGNGHGISLIVERRFQLDFDPPGYFRNHSAALKDGFGNAGIQLKTRIVSGNAAHGNYIVSAILWHGFSPGACQNGADSSLWKPTIAVGKAFWRFAVISNLGGLLPTSNLSQQGRTITWDTTAQIHPTAHIFFDLEDNSAFNRGGQLGAATQNFLTPAAYLALRRREWAPTHATIVFDCGMQVATTRFHFYNHNLVTEMRVFF